jgi:spore cortex formation protein SpoVR/YcgB (stage V sporulation)
MRRLNLEVVAQGSLYALTAESDFYDRIVTAQHNDEDIQTIKQKLAEGDPKYTCF